jgi:succinate dehydrogenase / fumarate reductase membrane anchor subunit
VIETPSVPKPREGTWLWLFKIAAGLMIVVLLLVHFVVNHLVAPGGLLTYADVVRYYSIPLIPAMEIVFLVFVVSHALVGLRSILLDLNPSDGLLRAADILFLLAGIGFTVYGIWLVWAIVQHGRAG